MDMKNACILCLWRRGETFWRVVVCKSLLIGNMCLQCTVGSDGIRIWYMKNQSQLRVPEYNLAQLGAVTCLRWITRSCDAEEILCYGTAVGYVGVWAHQPVSKGCLHLHLHLTSKIEWVQGVGRMSSTLRQRDFIHCKWYIQQGEPSTSIIKSWWFDYGHGNWQKLYTGADME